MPRTVLVLTTLLISVPTITQTTPPNCPTFSVVVPAGVTGPREPQDFRVELSNPIQKGIGFRWSVSNGVILKGQGTSSIRVRRTNPRNYDITATIELVGLPKTCHNTASASSIPIDIFPRLIDEFPSSTLSSEKGRFEFAVAEQRKSPDHLLYIIRYYEPGTLKSVMQENSRRTAALLTRTLKLRAAKFEIASAFGDFGRRTKIYLLHPWIEKPAP